VKLQGGEYVSLGKVSTEGRRQGRIKSMARLVQKVVARGGLSLGKVTTQGRRQGSIKLRQG
jgi:hypothetical protein